MRVTLFTSGHCRRCREASRLLDGFARREAPPGFDWREVSVRTAVEEAARLGIVAVPALVHNDTVVAMGRVRRRDLASLCRRRQKPGR